MPRQSRPRRGSAASPDPRSILSAQPGYITQPDGASDLLLGLRLREPARRALRRRDPSSGAVATTMQLPGPTLVVKEGDTVTVTLTNNLPAAAGNTSILFPGFK